MLLLRGSRGGWHWVRFRGRRRGGLGGTRWTRRWQCETVRFRGGGGDLQRVRLLAQFIELMITDGAIRSTVRTVRGVDVNVVSNCTLRLLLLLLMVMILLKLLMEGFPAIMLLLMMGEMLLMMVLLLLLLMVLRLLVRGGRFRAKLGVHD